MKNNTIQTELPKKSDKMVAQSVVKAKVYKSLNMYNTCIEHVKTGEPMTSRQFGLTLRQCEVLLSVAKTTNDLNVVTIRSLITDIGVGHATLADHLKAMIKYGYLKTIDDEKPRNMGFEDKIIITGLGKTKANQILNELGLSYLNTFNQISLTLRNKFHPGTQITLMKGTPTSSFTKAFESLIEKNSLEPILTSIAMYTDLDSQLNLLRMNAATNDLYVRISRTKLHLEIRNGRLASIALPIALRQRISYEDLKQTLGDSWSWLNTVNNVSINRYWQEAISLGLFQMQGSLLSSTKPSSVNTIQWLSGKTNRTFINTLPSAPKGSLVVFKECFTFPTEEDLLNPNQNDNLKWLNQLYENMSDKDEYRKVIREGLDITSRYTKLIQDYDGRLVPTTIIRKADSIGTDFTKKFKHLLKNKDTTVSKVLMIINAKPGMTVGTLKNELYNANKESNNVNKKFFSKSSVEDIISTLITSNLAQITVSGSAHSDDRKLYAFTHLPYFAPLTNTANSILRNMKPYILQRINELFYSETERQMAIEIFQKLNKEKQLLMDVIEGDYGRVIVRKFSVLSQYLKPFIDTDKDLSMLTLKADRNMVNEIVISSLLYSLVTQEDSLSIYNETIENMVEKDIPVATKLTEEAENLVKDIIKDNIKE